jgi:hypothetical protein
MLPADAFQMTHRLSTVCLPKMWQSLESDYELIVFVIHGDKYYIINSSLNSSKKYWPQSVGVICISNKFV